MTFTCSINPALARHFRIALAVAILGWFLPASSSAVPTVTQVADPPRFSSQPSANVAIFKGDSLPSRPYEILGRIFEDKNPLTRFSPKATLDNLVKDFVAPAQAIGADGIIGLHGAREIRKGESRVGWASGLAVRFLDEGQVPTRTSSDLVIGILPILTPPTITLGPLVPSLLLRALEKKGYYGVPITTRSARMDSAAVESASAAELAELSGTWAENILLVELVSYESTPSAVKTKWKTMFGEAEFNRMNVKSTLAATLYSVKSRSVIWENRSFFESWRGAFSPSDADDFDKTIRSLLDTLPDASLHALLSLSTAPREIEKP